MLSSMLHNKLDNSIAQDTDFYAKYVNFLFFYFKFHQIQTQTTIIIWGPFFQNSVATKRLYFKNQQYLPVHRIFVLALILTVQK